MLAKNLQKKEESILHCLQEMLPDLPDSGANALLKKGHVRLNGQRIKKENALESGDRLEVFVPLEWTRYLPEPEVVYEDENILIFNKEQGVDCTELKNGGGPTLYNLAVAYMRRVGEYDVSTLAVPYLCHMLDINTGGLVIVAKSQVYYEYIFEAIKQRRVRRFYRGIVAGQPPEEKGEAQGFWVKEGLASKARILEKPVRNAQPIITRYRVLATNQELSLLEIEPIGGRTHQIRAHLEKLGCPLLGDDLYGNKKANKKCAVEEPALWAYKIRFETGVNNALEYLDKKEFETERIQLPMVGLENLQEK